MTSSSSLPQDRQRLSESLRAHALMEEDVAWSHEIDGERDGEQYDRSARAALRRVAGLSTELEDVTEVEYRQLRLERVVLVGVWTTGTVQEAENSLAELAALAETAGALVLDGVIQRRDKPDPATYIGSGKALELRDIVLESGADTVVCDGELSPGQLIHLEDVVKVKVVDRTALILDIFAQHAKSRRARRRSRWRRCSTCSPGSVAGASRCPGRWAAVAPVRPAAVWPPVAPVRPRSRRTVGGSARRWRRCAGRSRR